MSNNSTVVHSGIGLPGVIFAILLVLKLTGTITWSWWWVTAPIWVPWVFFGSIFVFFLALYLLFGD